MPFLRPDADDLTTGWEDQAAGTTNLYQTVDETSFSDADYAVSPADPVSSQPIRFRLSNPAATIDTSQAVTIRVRGRFNSASNSVTVRLKEGTTTRATRTFTDISSNFATQTVTLTTDEKNAVTNWDNLFIEVEPLTVANISVLNVSNQNSGGDITVDYNTSGTTTVDIAVTTSSTPPTAAQIVAQTAANSVFYDSDTWSIGGNTSINIPSAINQSTCYMHVLPNGGSDGDIISSNSFGIDTTDPTLSAQSVTPGDTVLDFSATSTESTGTLFLVAVANGASAPSAAQVIAGTDASDVATDNASSSVTSTSVSGTITGLTNSTAYDVYAVHRDNVGNASAVVSVLNQTPVASSGPTTPYTENFTTDVGSWTAQDGGITVTHDAVNDYLVGTSTLNYRSAYSPEITINQTGTLTVTINVADWTAVSGDQLDAAIGSTQNGTDYDSATAGERLISPTSGTFTLTYACTSGEKLHIRVRTRASQGTFKLSSVTASVA